MTIEKDCREVTSECTVEFHHSELGSVVRVSHNGETVAYIGSCGIQNSCPKTYSIIDCTEWAHRDQNNIEQKNFWFRIFKKEEWKNVTRECVVKWCSNQGHSLIEVTHNGSIVGMFGLNQIEKSGNPDYRYISETTTVQGTQWFRVEKRVS